MLCARIFCFFFFFNDTATTEIYTLSLHDALPIYLLRLGSRRQPTARAEWLYSYGLVFGAERAVFQSGLRPDRKSTRLNSSHSQISYAVFCLKKKKNTYTRASHRARIIPYLTRAQC